MKPDNMRDSVYGNVRSHLARCGRGRPDEPRMGSDSSRMETFLRQCRREGGRPMREVRWERMFPDELEQRFQDCPVVYFAYGLCEPHGPQNAVGLDTLKAHAIACRAAQTHGGIVAPPDYWHIHE